MKWFFIFCGVLLLVAIPSWWPYDFYIILRWIIFLSSAYFALQLYNSKHRMLSLVFLAIFFIFNPLYPVYLEKSLWIIIDLVSAIIFFMASLSKIKKDNGNPFENLFDEHPYIVILLAIILVFMIIHWLNQPMKIIYDPNAPPY